MPSAGCDAISSGGSCFSYFTHSAITWYDARTACMAWGGNLATILSCEESALIITTSTGSFNCFIGLNDINTEGVFVWADGSTSAYRDWKIGEPNSFGGEEEDCGTIFSDSKWNDTPCNNTRDCYYCSTRGKIHVILFLRKDKVSILFV